MNDMRHRSAQGQAAHVSQLFDRAAHEYNAHSLLQQQSATRLLQWMRDDIRPHQIVLDAGAGTGYVSQPLAAQQCRVWAVDLAAQMLANMDGIDNIETICADMTALPFPDHMTDMVVSNFSLHWVGVSVLDELLRVVKPNGSLWLAVPVAGSLLDVCARYKGFQTFDFQNEYEWLQAVAPYLVSSFSQTFSQPFSGIRALMTELRQMGGNQTGQVSQLPLSRRRQQWQAWLEQDARDPQPINLTYQVLFLQLKKPQIASDKAFPWLQ